MKKVYRNRFNSNKYIEVTRYSCGHYYAEQVIRVGEVENRYGKGRYRKSRIDAILEDYEEI